jgi:predicted secreted protein
MFEDARSKKIILVAHCVLNQNTKLDRCAHYPGAIQKVAEVLIGSGVGLLQMPCPELMYLGLDRQIAPAAHPTVEEEDTRIARRMAEPDGQSVCQKIAAEMLYQMREYRRCGFEIAGVVGVNGSPTCGVETTWSAGQERPGPGLFIERLYEQTQAEGFSVAMRGIKAYQPQQALQALAGLLRGKADA